MPAAAHDGRVDEGDARQSRGDERCRMAVCFPTPLFKPNERIPPRPVLSVLDGGVASAGGVI